MQARFGLTAHGVLQPTFRAEQRKSPRGRGLLPLLLRSPLGLPVLDRPLVRSSALLSRYVVQGSSNELEGLGCGNVEITSARTPDHKAAGLKLAKIPLVVFLHRVFRLGFDLCSARVSFTFRDGSRRVPCAVKGCVARPLQRRVAATLKRGEAHSDWLRRRLERGLKEIRETPPGSCRLA